MRKQLKKLDKESETYDEERIAIQTKIDYINVRIQTEQILTFSFIQEEQNICQSSRLREQDQKLIPEEKKFWKKLKPQPKEMLNGD